jgi:predicted component of type VI protein secretion system
MQGSSFRLIVRRGPQPNQIYEFNKDVINLGRDITNDIVINDPEASRHHCRLTRGGGGFTVEDLQSTNGTFVNGQRLTGARPLSHGDTLGMGETVTLAYEAVGGAVEGRQVATVVGSPPRPSSEYVSPPAAQVPSYNQQPLQQAGGYPAPGVPAQQQPYGMSQQQPPAYEYDYQDEPYEGGGVGRWVVLGCGCFLVMCVVASVIAVIIIDSQCMWDDIPVISDMFDLGVKPGACE